MKLETKLNLQLSQGGVVELLSLLLAIKRARLTILF